MKVQTFKCPSDEEHPKVGLHGAFRCLCFFVDAKHSPEFGDSKINVGGSVYERTGSDVISCLLLFFAKTFCLLSQKCFQSPGFIKADHINFI